VENGAADAALVYTTDIATSHGVHTAFVVPVADGPRIVYPAAVVRSGANTNGGKQLLAFLRTDEAARVFERAGFRVVR
jgi:molybdate transport system substrate-binding protein